MYDCSVGPHTTQDCTGTLTGMIPLPERAVFDKQKCPREYSSIV